MIIATFETVPYENTAEGNPLQMERSLSTLDIQIYLEQSTRAFLLWWWQAPALRNGKSFLSLCWTVLMMDASLSCWGGVLGSNSAQGRWTPE